MSDDDTLKRINPADFPGTSHRVPDPILRSDQPVPAMAGCPECAGIGWLSSGPARGASGEGAPTGLVPCRCRQLINQHRRYQELSERSNLAAFREKTFAAFDPKAPGLSKAYGAALRYSVQLQGWLVLTGGYGVGKTHLAAAIGNAALDREVPVYFAVIGDLLDTLRATFDRERDGVSFDTLFRQVKEIPLLVMDDLGTEKESEWAREKIFQILDWRYSRALPTVLTSNRPEAQIDPRVISRAKGMAFERTILSIQGAKDYRLRNLHGGWLIAEPETPAPEIKRAKHA